jgi:hypothetical protein
VNDTYFTVRANFLVRELEVSGGEVVDWHKAVLQKCSNICDEIE